MSLEHANHKSAPDVTNIRLIIDQANKRLYDDACQKFGKQHVDSGHFNRSDLGEMAAVAILGPGTCKTLGHEKTKVAGAAIVSLVAPALLGGIEEGKKQFTQHTMETVNAGSGNALMGAGGGALYAWNPLVATGAAVVGAGFLIDDQLNSERNKERNNELLKVVSNLHKLDDRELTNAAIMLKSYLGPDAYNAAFTATTAGMGFKPGHEVGAAIKAEVSIDSLKTVAGQMGNMLANALEGLSARPQSVGLRPAFQGVGDCASNSAKSPLSNLFNFAMSRSKKEAFDGAQHPKHWEHLYDDGTKIVKKWLGRFRVTQTTNPNGLSQVDAWTLDARGSKISVSEISTPDGIRCKSFDDGTSWTLKRNGNSMEVLDKSANVIHTFDKKTGTHTLEATLRDGTVVQETPNLTASGRIYGTSRYYQVDGTKVEIIDWTVVNKRYGEGLGSYNYWSGYGGEYNPKGRRR